MDATFEEEQLRALVQSDESLMKILRAIKSVHLPNAWVTGGTVRNLAWNYLSQSQIHHSARDVDIIYYDNSNTEKIFEHGYEKKLQAYVSGVCFSAKNQARMHEVNGDLPYKSSEDALSKVPDIASAVAVALSEDDQIMILAPYGLSDLFSMQLRPTSYGREHLQKYRDRLTKKRWLELWPKLTISYS